MAELLNLEFVLGPVAGEVLLRVTMLLVLATLGVVALRRSSAALRHLLWALALAGTLLVPVFLAVLPSWQWSILPRTEPVAATWQANEERLSTMPLAPRTVAQNTPAADVPAPVVAERPAVPPARNVGSDVLPMKSPVRWNWPAVLVALWAVGAGLALARLAMGMLAAAAIARQSQPVDDPGWRVLLRELLQRTGHRRSMEIRRCRQVMVPMTWGLLRPVILVPASSDAWSDQTRRSVLMHELGHIRRGDCLVHLVGRLAHAIYWFHPLVWLAVRQLRTTSEHAADDAVLASQVAPPDYAEHLVAVAGQIRGLKLFGQVALPMACPSDLESRVLAILDPRRNRRALRTKTGIALALVSLVLLVPCTLLRLAYAQEPKPETPATAKQAESPATVSDHSDAALPALKQGTPRPAPHDLIRAVLDTNRHWLRPDPPQLRYTFTMEHPDKGDRVRTEVQYTAPSQIAVRRENQPSYVGLADDNYDPDNSAFPPRRLTLLQGVTMFGPLQELAMSPDGHALSIVGEEKMDGADAWVLQLRSTAEPGEEARSRRDDRLRRQATRSKYFYEFTPLERQVDGKPKAVLELKCVYGEGPGWKELLAAREKNPSEIRWAGCRIEAAIREYRGQVRPVIVLDREAGSTITSISFLEGGVGNVTPKLGLGEGERIVDEELYRNLKSERSPDRQILPMRIGCGIFGSWYGYSGGGADVDQVWVDKATRRILREEGFYKSEPRFVVRYRHFERTADGGEVPLGVEVRLLSKTADNIYPWVFRLQFQLLQKKTWLFRQLHESQGVRENVAIATVSDATVTAVERSEPQTSPASPEAKTSHSMPAAGDAIVEGVGWKDVRVGISREDLLKALGNPDNDPKSDVLRWAGKHIDCSFHTGSVVVSEVRFNSGFEGALANGIRLGSSGDAMLKLYGEPDHVMDRQNGAKQYEYSTKGILFWTYEKKITQIVVFKPYNRSSGFSAARSPNALTRYVPFAGDEKLTEAQRLYCQWDARTFGLPDPSRWANRSAAEKATAEEACLKQLADRSPEQEGRRVEAIDSLVAMRSKKAVRPILEIAADRLEKNNRDRHTACRALGMLDDKSVVSELVELTYHYNWNTRQWAQISLVRLTGQNFGNDVAAWKIWWEKEGGKPPIASQRVVWAKGPWLRSTLKGLEDPKKQAEMDEQQARRLKAEEGQR